ncbi:hypothetical protein GcM1_216030 [Golovinomyces cichoracearum]|uniref:Uncharacterized protein n=1 Tax=Golovinomyces cichoracearum TaxID=62708 RepID=A0A420ITE6_9PEZI|nr:hypothetical protein GcM1_216030 [Golovinomyces cichoracearum]
MNFLLPDCDNSSLSSISSFQSFRQRSPSDLLSPQLMTETDRPTPEINMANTALQDPFENFSAEDKQELFVILQQRRNLRTQSVSGDVPNLLNLQVTPPYIQQYHRYQNGIVRQKTLAST